MALHRGTSIRQAGDSKGSLLLFHISSHVLNMGVLRWVYASGNLATAAFQLPGAHVRSCRSCSREILLVLDNIKLQSARRAPKK